MKIRVVQKQDAAQISEIYSPYVQNTTITFETESPDAEEFCRRIEKVTRDLPWLVCEENGKILGYTHHITMSERLMPGMRNVLSMFGRRCVQKESVLHFTVHYCRFCVCKAIILLMP